MRAHWCKTEWGGKGFHFWPHACRYDGLIFAYYWLGFLWYPKNSELGLYWDELEKINEEEDKKESRD